MWWKFIIPIGDCVMLIAVWLLEHRRGKDIGTHHPHEMEDDKCNHQKKIQSIGIRKKKC